jgi:hypothetical protein
MSFRGELREFELPDILQLIASQQKAGWLKAISRGECQFVFFRDGKITSTKNPQEETDPLETYIANKGILTDDQSDRVAAIRRKTGMDVQDVLVKEGLFTHDEVQDIFEAMVERDIFELMSIRSGTYEFETEERPGPLPEGALHAEIGPILMEAARKADEVSEMRKALGPENGILVLTPLGRDPGDSSIEERTLLELVNGIRSIDAIVEESGVDRYTGMRVLFDCARKGWVALIKSRDELRPASVAVDGSFPVARTLRWILPVVGLLFAAVLFSNAFDAQCRDDPVVGEWLNRSAQLKEASRRETVRVAVEVYRVKNGQYPEALQELATDGLISETLLGDVATNGWDYARSPSGQDYVLLPVDRSTANEID